MSYLKNVNFTDPQGVTHTEATFGAAQGVSYYNATETFQRGIPDYDTLTVPPIQKSRNVNVQFYYWTNEQARLDGMDPYILANRVFDENDVLQQVKMSFDFEAAGSEYDGLDLYAQCMYYLENVILA